MGQIWDKFQPAIAAAEFAWDLLRVLVLYVIPVGIATAFAVTALYQAGHGSAVGVLLAGEFVGGMALAVIGHWGGQPSSPTVRQINRRAAVILPLAAVALATLLAGMAVRPAVLGVVVAGALIMGVPAAGALVVSELLYRGRRRRAVADVDQAPCDDELATVYIGGQGDLVTVPAAPASDPSQCARWEVGID